MINKPSSLGFGFSDNLNQIGQNLEPLRASLGFVSSLNPTKRTADQFPWGNGGSAGQPNSFFKPLDIDAERWNKLYPYRLAVIDISKGNSIVSSYNPSAPKTSAFKENYKIKKSEYGSYLIEFETTTTEWVYNLPITPQQIQITTPYAINTSATLKGVLEEHGGTRFKSINMAGTFGIWPFRPQKSLSPGSPGVFGTLFAGTLENANLLAGQVNRVINSATSNHPVSKPTALKPGDNGDLPKQSTGYYQCLLMDQFLEQYAEAKRDPKNKNWRLVLQVAKENQAFVVTPVQFTYFKSSESPNEYKFNLQLRAWKRISLEGGEYSKIDEDSVRANINALQRALTTITEARRTLAISINLIKAVRSDFRTPLNALRQISFFIKDFVGLTIAVADLPNQIIGDYRSTIKESFPLIGQPGSDLAKNASAISKVKSVQNQIKNREGLSDSAIKSGQIGAASQAADKTDPSNEIFENPEENFEIFNAITLDQVKLTPPQQEAIDLEVEKIRLITVDDIREKRAEILKLGTQISNVFGAGNSFFSTVYSFPAPIARAQEMTIDEFVVLKTIYDVAQTLDLLTATQDLDDQRINSAYEYVGALAQDADFTFIESQSKMMVPVPFGLNIEQIAARYLDDPDRWLEIVTLNALKEPYIDENGFFRSLLSNADGRQFNINSVENLYVGQKIIFSSLTQPQESRRIINIEQINETNYLITADGLDNLDIYTIADKAKIQAFLPGTINSQNQIFIPTEDQAPNDVRTRPVSTFKNDPLVGLSKIDILLTENGDVALNNYGDFRLAGGLTNIVQALKMKFAVIQGRLIKHPQYGSSVQPGISIAELDAKEIVETIRNSIQEDTRFSQIERLEISLNGPTLTINLSVSLANNQGIVPISFGVRVK